MWSGRKRWLFAHGGTCKEKINNNRELNKMGEIFVKKMIFGVYKKVGTIEATYH